MSEGIKVISRVITIPRREIMKHGNRWNSILVAGL